MLNRISFSQIEAEVRKLVNENPYNSYYRGEGESCSYVKGGCTNGSVGCIFGQALKNLGVEGLKELEDNLRQKTNQVSIKFLLKALGIWVTKSQAEWCESVQAKQDQGRDWIDAVRWADLSMVID